MKEQAKKEAEEIGWQQEREGTRKIGDVSVNRADENKELKLKIKDLQEKVEELKEALKQQQEINDKTLRDALREVRG